MSQRPVVSLVVLGFSDPHHSSAVPGSQDGPHSTHLLPCTLLIKFISTPLFFLVIRKVVNEAAKNEVFPSLPPSLAEEDLQKLSVETCNWVFMCTPRVKNLTTGNNALSEEVKVSFLREKTIKISNT